MTPEKLIQGSIKLVSLPEVFFQINEMLDDPRFGAVEIGNVINKDPAMTVRLLKIVNSALYNFPSRIDTLSRAVAIVGIDEIRNVALATAAVEQFNDIPNDLVDMTDFWLRSVYCGVVARILAKECAVLHSERMFIAGLLHELGSLLLYNKMPVECREILLAADGNQKIVGDLEQDILGFTYADVGKELAKLWKLPESLQEAIGCHLYPEEAGEYRLDAHLINLAKQLTGVILFDDDEKDVLAGVTELSSGLLRINEEQIMNVLKKAPEEISEVFDLILPNVQSSY